MSSSLHKAIIFLDSCKKKPLTSSEKLEGTVKLAEYLLEASLQQTNKEEKKTQRFLANMLKDRRGKAFILSLTDQAFRSKDPRRTVDQVRYLLTAYDGIPEFLPDKEKFGFILFQLLGEIFPKLCANYLKKQIQHRMSSVLLPEKSERFFQDCKDSSIIVNLNHLGEDILSEKQAEERLQLYLQDLANPEIRYLSIKLTSIYSQISPIAWNASLETVTQKLRLLFKASQDNLYTLNNNQKVPKRVHIDMEEYKHVEFTLEAFKKVLSEEAFLNVSAGIVLQSYLPDSFEFQRSLTDWALDRYEKGGAPIHLRIVKGANMAMESFESQIKNWPLSTYHEKKKTDANFLRMIDYGLDEKRSQAVHIGVATHNLLSIAYALIGRAEKHLESKVSFEMLYGMARPLERVIAKIAGEITLYCPEIKQDFQNSVAYFVRRLDENTGSKNFLKDLFQLKPQNPNWKTQKAYFFEAFQEKEYLLSDRHRSTHRFRAVFEKNPDDPFSHEPDTDFSIKENREWMTSIFKPKFSEEHSPIPLLIAGEMYEKNVHIGRDPSCPDKILYQYSEADQGDIEKALQCAEKFVEEWQMTTFQKRCSLLSIVAYLFRKKRHDLIEAIMKDGGKILEEADAEVSEAIDFIEYYIRQWEKILDFEDIDIQPKGVLLVTPPWNFPCSIPTGAIVGALITGNTVLFKPAPETVLVGWKVVQLFYEAGIPKEALQFIPCADEPTGSALIQDPRIRCVVLTGATQTAVSFLHLHPGLDLVAETGGKNTLIVTALADRDLSIRSIIKSAFSHSGQKCSALSLVILEAEVYDDGHFLEQLKEATKSLCVGSVWDPRTQIAPLIRAPSENLLRAFTTLEEGESWLLKPTQDPNHTHLWSPGIKLGVQKDSFTHQTELFGPLLGLMRAKDLQEAIQFANATPYGLTAGLHSLDKREQDLWKDSIVAGSLYINRPITGAIVQRQPFGGCKASSYGPSCKAGGPNYLTQFVNLKHKTLPEDLSSLPKDLVPLFSSLFLFQLTANETLLFKKSCESYAHWMKLFSTPHDQESLPGQENLFFSVPLEGMCVRLYGKEPIIDILRIYAASLITKTPLYISSEVEISHFKHLPLIHIEDEATFYDLLQQKGYKRIRLLQTPSEELKKKATCLGIYLIHQPVLANGRFELLHYLREVSLSYDYHRYGNLNRLNS